MTCNTVKLWSKALLVSGTLFVHSLAFPTAVNSQKVDDFVLLDHTGTAHQLYYHNDATAIVLIVQGNGCQIVRSLLTDYRALRDDYAGRGVRVFMLNANLQDTREAIAAEAASYAIDIPILHDSAQI
ncbi:MAG: redoxin domain-containing protein, partial [Pseudomonadales bacterium]